MCNARSPCSLQVMLFHFLQNGEKFSGQGMGVSLSTRNSEYSATQWSSAEKVEIFSGRSRHGHCHLTAQSCPIAFKEQFIILFPLSSSQTALNAITDNQLIWKVIDSILEESRWVSPTKSVKLVCACKKFTLYEMTDSLKGYSCKM